MEEGNNKNSRKEGRKDGRLTTNSIRRNRNRNSITILIIINKWKNHKITKNTNEDGAIMINIIGILMVLIRKGGRTKEGRKKD